MRFHVVQKVGDSVGFVLPTPITQNPWDYEVGCLGYSFLYKAPIPNQGPISICLNILDHGTFYDDKLGWIPAVHTILESQTKGRLTRMISDVIYHPVSHADDLMMRIEPVMPVDGYVILDFRRRLMNIGKL